MLINALRGHLGEYGIVAARGPAGERKAMNAVIEEEIDLPALATPPLIALCRQLTSLDEEIRALEKRILDWDRANETSRRLATIPGMGPITATAIAATVPDPSQFRSGRRFAAWLGLTLRAESSGGKERNVGISKMGDG